MATTAASAPPAPPDSAAPSPSPSSLAPPSALPLPELLAPRRRPRAAPSPLALLASTHAPFDDLRPPSLVSDRTSTVSSTGSPRLSLALPSPFVLPLLPAAPAPKFKPYAHDVFGDDGDSVHGSVGAPSPVPILRSGFAGARAVSSSTAGGADEAESSESRAARNRRKHRSVVPVKGVTTPHGTPRTARFPDLHRPLPALPPGLERPAKVERGDKARRPKGRGKSIDKGKGRAVTPTTATAPSPAPAPLDPAPAPPLPPAPASPHAPVALSPAPAERAERERPVRPWIARVHRVCRRTRFRRLRRRWRLVCGRSDEERTQTLH